MYFQINCRFIMDSKINTCESETRNITSNLSLMLEKIHEEQTSLSARVCTLEREKTNLEEKIATNRKISNRREEKLTSLEKRILLVTRDIKSRKAKFDSLAGDDTESKSVLESLVSRIDESNIKAEISNVTKTFLSELSSDLGADWERIADAICELEQEKDQESHLSDEGRNKEVMSLQLSDLRDKEGPIKLLHDYNNGIDIKLQQLNSEHEKLKNHCDDTEKVNKERRGILTRHEMDNKVDEGRLQTLKERLQSMLDSVGDGE